MDEIGNTPLGDALDRINKILAKATEPDTLLDILKEIRSADTCQFVFVPGYAGALRARRIIE